MTVGVSSYSFRDLVKDGRLDIYDIPAKAKGMGFDAIEFWDGTIPADGNEVETAGRLRDAAAKAGIDVCNYAAGADLIAGKGVPAEKEVDRLFGVLEVAQALGTPCMRHDATSGFKGSFDQALPTLVDGCRKVTEMAASMGIKTTVENHGYFAQDSDRIEKLVTGVNHDNFGVLVDMGNFTVVDENPVTAVGRLAPFAFYVHAKDMYLKPGTDPDPGSSWNRSRGGNFWRGAIVGHGDVPVRQCLTVLKKAGYDGVVSIEFEGLEEPEVGISLGLENLKRYVAEA